MTARKRLVVGISGASGAVWGIRLLEVLRESRDVETHLVVTPAAERIIAAETGLRLDAVRSLASAAYACDDVGACIASGSFPTMGMVVVPCSIRSASAIAHGISDNLLIRAADVALKERRRLVLVVRETPLHQGHLKSLLEVTQSGGIVMPPVPAFYGRPQTIADLVDQTVGRVLDLFGIDNALVQRWRPSP
jgi:4-hydroxy-3-polyprenylbenzoate decarboxylase